MVETASPEGQKSASTTEKPPDAKREAQEEEEEEVSLFVAAWREIKRRIVAADENLGWILSSTDNFIDFLKYVAEPSRDEALALEIPA